MLDYQVTKMYQIINVHQPPDAKGLSLTCGICSEYGFYDVRCEVVPQTVTAVRLRLDVGQKSCGHAHFLSMIAPTILFLNDKKETKVIFSGNHLEF